MNKYELDRNAAQQDRCHLRYQLNVAGSIATFLILTPVIAIGLLSSIGACREAFGCSCVEPQPPAEALEENKTVFSGKVVIIDSNEFGKSVTFDVDRAWKGVTKDRVTVATPANSAACGYEFEEGKEYLIYSHDDDETLDVTICSRTQPLDEATADLIVLGEGYQPVQASDEGNVVVKETNIVSLFNMPVIIGIGAAVAGIIAFLSIRKYKK